MQMGVTIDRDTIGHNLSIQKSSGFIDGGGWRRSGGRWIVERRMSICLEEIVGHHSDWTEEGFEAHKQRVENADKGIVGGCGGDE